LAYLNFKQEQENGALEEVVIQDNRTFEEVIVGLDTSEKLIDYLNKYFTIEDRGDDEAYTPEEFFQRKRGGEQDFAVFASHVLDYHNYEVAIVSYNSNLGDNYIVTIFRDVDLPKYITLTDNGIEIFAHGWSFEELFETEEKRLNIEIIEYAIFYPNIQNLVVDEWIKRK